MTAEQQKKAAAFFAVMWDFFPDCHQMDGSDLQAALEKSGLAEWRPATAAQAECGGEECEEGDPLLFLNDDGKAVLAAAKEPAP